MKVSYDGFKERVRVLEELDATGQRTLLYEYIILYREQRLYRIERGTSRCTVSRFEEPFKPAEIPRDATFASQGYVGPSALGFVFKAYYGLFGNEGDKGVYVISVTEEGCVAMYSKVVSKATGIVRASFYNVVLGIEDPTVFQPPKSCEQAPLPDGMIPVLKLY